MRKKLQAIIHLVRSKDFTLITKDYGKVNNPVSNTSPLDQLNMIDEAGDKLLDAIADLNDQTFAYETAYN